MSDSTASSNGIGSALSQVTDQCTSILEMTGPCSGVMGSFVAAGLQSRGNQLCQHWTDLQSEMQAWFTTVGPQVESACQAVAASAPSVSEALADAANADLPALHADLQTVVSALDGPHTALSAAVGSLVGWQQSIEKTNSDIDNDATQMEGLQGVGPEIVTAADGLVNAALPGVVSELGDAEKVLARLYLNVDDVLTNLGQVDPSQLPIIRSGRIATAIADWSTLQDALVSSDLPVLSTPPQ